MRNMKFLAIALGIICLSIFVYRIFTGNRINLASSCVALGRFKNKSFHGVVYGKFINQKNHGAKTILLENGKFIVLAEDTSKFFNFVQKGDSLSKLKRSERIMIFRNKIVDSIKITFNCPQFL